MPRWEPLPPGEYTAQVTDVKKKGNNIITKLSVNGHKSDINLRNVIDWLFHKATTAEMDTLELVVQNVGKDG